MAIAFRGQFYYAAEGHSYFAREGQRRLPSGVKCARLFQHVQMTVQGLGFKQSSDTFIPGSESEHRWQDEHPDGTFINK